MRLADLGTNIHGLTGHSALIDAAMRFSADYLIYGVLAVLAALWFYSDGLRAGVAFGAGLVVALLIGLALGTLWGEQRPFVADHFAPLISHGPDGSFPSDHLLVLGALVGACWPRARLLGLIGLTLALVVAVARVYVGVHYPLDVTAGLAIGAACGVGAWAACAVVEPALTGLDRFLARRRLRPILFGGRNHSDQLLPGAYTP